MQEEGKHPVIQDAMTVQLIADQLNVSPSTVRRMIQDGRMPGMMLEGKRRLYRVERARFLEFLQKNGYQPA